MTIPLRSTIAQMLYPTEKALDFPRIVAELETVLTRLRGEALDIDWDCDDIVYFDTDDTRIMLSCAQYGRTGQETCLIVAVGPSDLQYAIGGAPDLSHPGLCSRLVERIRSQNTPEVILWSEVEGPMNSDVADALMDRLAPIPAAAQPLPPVDSILDAVLKTDQSKTDTSRLAAEARGRVRPSAMRPNPMRQNEDGTTRPAQRPMAARPAAADETQVRLRRAFGRPKAGEPRRAATPVRVLAHTMNAATILVYPPIGAAVMTYSLLKGEDIRLSARIMSVAVALLGLTQTPFGQTVSAVAGNMVRLAQLPLGQTVKTIVGA